MEGDRKKHSCHNMEKMKRFEHDIDKNLKEREMTTVQSPGSIFRRNPTKNHGCSQHG